MLNKRVKSLLVAGLLVFNMSGHIFAAEVELPASGMSYIEYPDFGAFSYKEYKLQGGNIILTLYKDSNGYRANIEWVAENFKVTGVKLIYEDESFSVRDIMLPGEAEEGQDCYVAVPNGDNFKVAVNDGIKDKKLVRVEVMFENLSKDDEPVTPPVDPEEPPVDPEDPVVPPVDPEDPVVPPVDPEEPPVEEPEENFNDPETGDASIMPIVGMAIASAAGLFVLNKKDDEE